MALRIVVAVTDGDWFNQLRRRPEPAEVNFWSPSPRAFRALQPGELFLFKLHAPINMIVGGGVFASSTIMPLVLAWEAFGTANGVSTLAEMRTRILQYRRGSGAETGPLEVGCRMLTQPFFLAEDRWSHRPVMVEKHCLVHLVQYGNRRRSRSLGSRASGDAASLCQLNSCRSKCSLWRANTDPPEAWARGVPVGCDGSIWETMCNNERAHASGVGGRTYSPYADGGEHSPSNGILMRRDIHSLFDQGYVTITPEHRFEVSRRIREEFENGRHYYDLHGSQVEVPKIADQHPDPNALQWHNTGTVSWLVINGRWPFSCKLSARIIAGVGEQIVAHEVCHIEKVLRFSLRGSAKPVCQFRLRDL
jgi:putative restriction endonuclease